MVLHCIYCDYEHWMQDALVLCILRYGIVVLPQLMLVAPDVVWELLRNQNIYYRSYKAEAAGQKPKGILVFHHGYGCYCAFYDQGDIAIPRPNAGRAGLPRREFGANNMPL